MKNKKSESKADGVTTRNRTSKSADALHTKKKSVQPKSECTKKCANKTVTAPEDVLEEEEDGFVEIGNRSAPRKIRNPSKWKKNVHNQIKRDVYQTESVLSVPKCKHKRGLFKSNEICYEDVVFIRKIFGNQTNTADQNKFILTQITVDPVKRHRPRDGSRSEKSASATFFLRLKSAKRIRVCEEAFAMVLGIGLWRLAKLVAFYNRTGEAKPEGRGGDHKKEKYGNKREGVENFIKKLKARESHYGRKKSVRLYLPHELKSIKNLCKIYNADKEPKDQVQYGFFKNIFRTKFNLAFGTPRTDVCSFCLRKKHLILVDKDAIKRQFLRGQLKIHKRKANEFYKILKKRVPGQNIVGRLPTKSSNAENSRSSRLLLSSIEPLQLHAS